MIRQQVECMRQGLAKHLDRKIMIAELFIQAQKISLGAAVQTISRATVGKDSGLDFFPCGHSLRVGFVGGHTLVQQLQDGRMHAYFTLLGIRRIPKFFGKLALVVWAELPDGRQRFQDHAEVYGLPALAQRPKTPLSPVARKRFSLQIARPQATSHAHTRLSPPGPSRTRHR